jgi:23S rRNA (cytosine1962-C5)-methyltransferase
MASLPSLQLKKNESRRLRAGHLWVFSNEVDIQQTPLDSFEPGSLIEVVDDKGKFIGNGYINPHSLICARLVSRDRKYSLDSSLLVHRLKVALSLRQRLFTEPCYRLVYGESDGLPGLIIDRFGNVVSVQITTAGMEAHKDDIITALNKVLRPETIIFRNDSPIRELEGLEKYNAIAQGEPPEFLEITENGCRFQAPALTGQKTGWFYDHRLNRARATQYVKDQRILDVFSYLGAWGIPAAVSGAKEVFCIDSSAAALDQVEANAELNNVADKITTIEGDAFAALKALREDRERFDVVLLDPPAFIKRRKDIQKGLEAYRRINQLAMQVLSRDGILVSASCSYHLQRDRLQEILLKTSRHLDRNLVLLEQGHQGPDHPIHPAIPETNYLKAFFCRVMPS